MHRVETIIKQNFVDSLAESTLRSIRNDLGMVIDDVRTVRAYTLQEDFNEEELEVLGKELFSDALIESFSVDEPILPEDYDCFIEISFKKGVTDNVGSTASVIVNDILGKRSSVSSSIRYLIKAGIDGDKLEMISKKLLGNELIENFIIGKISDGLKFKNNNAKSFAHKPDIKIREMPISFDALKKISAERCLALSDEEIKAIIQHFSDSEILDERKKRGLSFPTEAEIEMLAQTWSEHCKHKIFNAEIEYTQRGSEGASLEVIDSLFKTYIRGATERIAKPWLVSVFKDNAGVIKLDEDYDVVFKVETHNSPSALDPYGGALTGIVGCNRDPMGTGKGARLIANTDVFCFADPFYPGSLPERIMHPKRVFDGVRKGVEHGGNKLGVPTVNGAIVFDNRFMGKPLVYCGTVGIMPHEIDGEKTAEKSIDSGDLIVIVGGRTGKDGIHGATFSSEELHKGSPVTAVQIGDPITQKMMMDFLLEARDKKLIKFITDNGAGGISCSVGEMAALCGGAVVDIEKVPLKYPQMEPWEILLSESQERMTLAVSPENVEEFMGLSKSRDVESTVIGEFNGSGKAVVSYAGKVFVYLNLDFLHEGVPKMRLKAEWHEKERAEPDLEIDDYNLELKNILGRLNICSKECVVRQYDHEVQGSSVIKPFMGAENDGPSDSSVIRPLEMARKNSWVGIAVSNAVIPRYSDIDTYDMAACCIDEVLRNVVCVGADPDRVALLDNFCWPDPVLSEKTPDGKHKLAQLVRANKALFDYSVKFGAPFISGKDSMKNDYKMGGAKISVPPTLLISALAKVRDVRKCITMDAKNSGDFVYVLGETKDELGGSEFYAMHGIVGKNVPKVDAESAIKRFRELYNAISSGLVNSCHDCSDGGLIVALAEAAFSGSLGMKIGLEKVSSGSNKPYKILFSESQSRFVVTVSPEKADYFEKVVSGAKASKIGVVQDDDFMIMNEEKELVNVPWRELKEAWQKTLRW